MPESDSAPPKVFISYSWSSSGHQTMVKDWADRLLQDGVDVIIDIYDLNHGDDKYSFMESMVTDSSVTHVLVVCDSVYAEKANARSAGVGTESQIISSELYNNVKQSKFIPLLCEFTEDDEPTLPVFMAGRIGINFSSAENVNKHWEELIRQLYGKPQHIKPAKGKPPAFITSEAKHPPIEPTGKFRLLKQALIEQKTGISGYRKDFLKSCIAYADTLRVREHPDFDIFAEKVHSDCLQLKEVRNLLCEWLSIECEMTSEATITVLVTKFLEDSIHLKQKPPELNPYNNVWFESHSVFLYELFLYFVAILIEHDKSKALNGLFKYNYLTSESNNYGEPVFQSFDCFWGDAEFLQKVLSPPDRKLRSPAAEYIKLNADQTDIPFSNIMQAELLTLLMAFLTPGSYWLPQTLFYSQLAQSFPLFVKATRAGDFEKSLRSLA